MKLKLYGVKLTAPYNYKDYLTAKYGDWSEPVKEWHCKDDKKRLWNRLYSHTMVS